MARGGRRSGVPGVSYPNRTDLTGQRALPATAATGQPYGAAGAQIAAQQAVPIVPPAVAAPPPAAGGTPPILPGSLTPLDAPTMRPNEPVTAGAPVGAGPGPEALGLPGQPDTVSGLVNKLDTTGSSDLAYLAAFVNAGRR